MLLAPVYVLFGLPHVRRSVESPAEYLIAEVRRTLKVWQGAAMPSNAIYTHFNPAEMPPQAGPQELVACLIAGRESVPGLGPSHLAVDELRELVQVAFNAGLRSDEGRFPKFQLVAYWSGEVRDAFPLLSFAEPIPVTVDNIRRLAPAFSHVSHALVVRSINGGLVLTGVDSTERWTLGPPGRPEFWAGIGRQTGLRLRVDDPGELFASETALRLRLRAGAISDLVPIGHQSEWQPWRRSAAQAILDELRARDVQDLETLFGGETSVAAMVGHILAHVLERVTTARHGGAIVIVPPAGHRHLRIRWPLADLSPRKTAAEWWQASADASRSPTPETIRSHGLARDKLFHMTRSLADLTRVDGCLVMSPQFEVVGVGAEILINEEEAQRSALVFADLKTGDPWPEQSGADLGGTRHRSAYRLCRVVPNSLAFVVSQDGDLTMIISSDEKVHAIRGLTADQRFG